MNPRALLTAFALLAVLAVAAPSTTGAKEVFRPCSGSFDPLGNRGGGFYRKIMAKRATCDTARAVTRAWIVAHRSGRLNPTRLSVIQDFSCTGTAPAEHVLNIVCKRDRGYRAVQFKGSP